MSRILASSVVALVVATGAASAIALDQNEKYMIHGAVTCGGYLDFRRNGQDASISMWLAGYFTATNYHVSNTYDILGNSDIPSALLWLDNFCRNNPLDLLAAGARTLLVELYSRRKVRGSAP